MNTVLSLIILLRQNNLKKDTTYSIANYVLENISRMEDISIKQLSEDCFVSTTSIIKFCNLLGFSGYTEFKRHLIASFQTRKVQLYDKHKNLKVSDLLNKISDFSIDFNAEQCQKSISSLVDLICENKRIHFYGAVFPMNLVQSFVEDMAVMGVPVFVYQIPYGKITIQSKEGINIIVTLSGRYIETHQMDYRIMCEINQNTVLISQEKKNIGNVLMNIVLPKTISSDYDDIVLLLILDMIKLEYYNRLKK